MTSINPSLVNILKQSGTLLVTDGNDRVRIEDYNLGGKRITVNHMDGKPVSVSGFDGELPVEDES